MLTEQEVLAVINEKLGKDELKPSTMRYINKIKVLDNLLKEHQASFKSLTSQAQAADLEIQRIKGATSILLELVAEEEGLLAKPENSQ